ncbi:hypothetical protein OAT67_08720, partial [Bacteriovoracaceae bacterium]|nr:hypothetical protein [Bacteriovoracaceae bacterium]
QGTVTVNCPTETRIVNCYDSYLSPSSVSKFTYEGAQEVDKVKLEAIHEDGDSRDKSSRMKNGVSTKRINLWISTLFQRPLLDYGQNIVNYTFSNNGREVESAQLNVVVEQLPTRYCSWGTYRAFSDSQCQNTASICSDYFRRYNDCR